MIYVCRKPIETKNNSPCITVHRKSISINSICTISHWYPHVPKYCWCHHMFLGYPRVNCPIDSHVENPACVDRLHRKPRILHIFSYVYSRTPGARQRSKRSKCSKGPSTSSRHDSRGLGDHTTDTTELFHCQVGLHCDYMRIVQKGNQHELGLAQKTALRWTWIFSRSFKCRQKFQNVWEINCNDGHAAHMGT